MDGRLPKRLYYLLLEHGDGKKLRVYEKGGGKYTRLDHAVTQRDRLRNKGVNCKVYQSQELVWEEVLTD